MNVKTVRDRSKERDGEKEIWREREREREGEGEGWSGGTTFHAVKGWGKTLCCLLACSARMMGKGVLLYAGKVQIAKDMSLFHYLSQGPSEAVDGKATCQC